MSADDELLRRLKAGERRTLAQLLSLAESTKSEDEFRLGQLLKRASAQPRGIRIGITGIPGAGKSSLIDALGAHLLATGKRVAVLAVDPSSPLSGGSILGDKVRMSRLAQADAAFVRPLANGGLAGGGVYALDDCVRLCELAGYDVVLVETVGVGQNEVDVGLVCDVTLLLTVPGAGDEIQALKRGITEMVDVIGLNKSDLVTAAELEVALSNYREGSSYLRKGAVPVLSLSATTGTNIEVLATCLLEKASHEATGAARAARRQLLLRRTTEYALLRRFGVAVATSPEFAALTQALGEGRLSLRDAVVEALNLTGSALEHQTYPPGQD